MRVGMTVVFQNPHDGEADHTVYADELRLADLAEPLGFDSIWGVEHHFTDYTMCPDGACSSARWWSSSPGTIRSGSRSRSPCSTR